VICLCKKSLRICCNEWSHKLNEKNIQATSKSTDINTWFGEKLKPWETQECTGKTDELSLRTWEWEDSSEGEHG